MCDCPDNSDGPPKIWYGCVGNKCEQYPCTSDDKCKEVSLAFKCQNGQCTSKKCKTSLNCPIGSLCNGYGLCETQQGIDINWIRIIIIFLFIIIATVVILTITYFVYKKIEK